MSENNVIETFLQNGGSKLQEIPGYRRAVVIGSQQELKTLDHLAEKPVRIEEQRKFDDLRGFVDYVNAFKGDNTAAFASRDRIEVVFDYHGKDDPSWNTHKITFTYNRSGRWALWEKNNNVWKDQEIFADFLDSGLNEIVEPTESAVLDLVKNFRATLNAEAESSITADGTQFAYRQTLRGGAKKTDITIPEYLTVQVAPFNGLQVLNGMIADESKRIPTYSFRAKLSWRMKSSSDVSKPDFKIQLLNFDRAIDETLEAVRGALKELTGVTTYIGG